MSFDPDKYLAELIMSCRSAFEERLLYIERRMKGIWQTQ